MQQLDTQEYLMQDGLVDGGAEDDGSKGALPMKGDNEAETEPGPGIPTGQPPPAMHA